MKFTTNYLTFAVALFVAILATSTSAGGGGCNKMGCEALHGCNNYCPGGQFCHLDKSECMDVNTGSRCILNMNCRTNQCVNGTCT